MLSSTVRGIVGERAPKCAFISNKRGYEATFGAELLAAGHDPRDVLNKYETDRIVIPFLQRHIAKEFPWLLEWRKLANSDGLGSCLVNSDEEEKAELESQLDIVLWQEKNQVAAIGGKAFVSTKKNALTLSVPGNEYETWRQLINAHLVNSEGVDVQTVGQRTAPNGALRAEITNSAARHIHTLRKRLQNPQDIVTAQGHYQLANHLSAGIVRAAK